MEALKLENLQYSYKDGQQVLRGINASFELGKIYAIVGPSGCGKTTLLSLLGGLDEPSSGAIKIDNENINAKGLLSYRKNKVSFIFQNYNLIDYLTAGENVSLISKESPMPLLEKVGLSKELEKRSIMKLSGGQQQRVAIARALISEANVLLADEPTGALDEYTQSGIIELLKNAAHEMKKCVIVVTHSHELSRNCDVVYQLKQGLLHEINFKDQEEAESVNPSLEVQGIAPVQESSTINQSQTVLADLSAALGKELASHARKQEKDDDFPKILSIEVTIQTKEGIKREILSASR